MTFSWMNSCNAPLTTSIPPHGYTRCWPKSWNGCTATRDSMFAADEKEFAEECFSLLLDVSGHQERHLYQKGLRDGVTILKRLGVSAT